ncbi:probable Bax inhibitor 1 [Macrosteles quadrilineatus]|uniref:probable Bax inhibitor 1 n=1 Tax=Macrosteles quadrilineatus TaxID=74068 RepID=UPI0023E103AE|nr:probable Bax inhibitor 1 [Macrosteles quadrilineatus]XP_054269683.1 probable Bax inhibitor 1 [Macrosteles quadrilineatus]
MERVARTFTESFTSKLEEPVRTHLKNVYACLTMSTVAAAVGAYVHMYTEILSAGLLTVIAAVGLLFALMSTPDNGKNRQMRVGFLLGFAFFSGLGMGPLLDMAVSINPQIIVTAFIGTSVVFASFSIAAMTAQRGQWLYLGGTLMTLLSSLLLLSLANILLGSRLIFQIYLYLGLFLMCGFVLYDTQLIIEKRRSGDKDFVIHSVDLFIDFIGIFRRLVIILSEKENRNQRKKE